MGTFSSVPEDYDLHSILDACILRGSCYSLACLCLHGRRCCCSVAPACLPDLFTWSLPMIIINKYDDILLCPAERARRPVGEKEGWGREWRRVHRKINFHSPVVYIFFMSLTYSTHSDIKTVVCLKLCHDKNGDSKSIDEVMLQPRLASTWASLLTRVCPLLFNMDEINEWMIEWMNELMKSKKLCHTHIHCSHSQCGQPAKVEIPILSN